MAAPVSGITGPATWLRRGLSAFWREIRLSHNSFMVPVEGWFFVAVTLAIGLAAINTATQLLFLIFSMMCAFWTLSAILATTSLRGVTLRRMAPRIATAGEAVTVRIRASNIKRKATSFSLRVMDELKDGATVGAVFFARVHPGEEAVEEYRCVFPRRGVYQFRSLTLATRFPFGLIERHWTREIPDEIVVLPAIIDVRRLMRPMRSRLGEIEAHRRGRGTGIYGLREYVPGESSRDIHWKVSAKRGELMLREYEEEERRKASVVLDSRMSGTWGRKEHENFESAIVLAGSVLAYLLREGHEVELITASGRVGFDSGMGHLGRCRRALATLKPIPRAGTTPPKGTTSEADCVRILITYGKSTITPAGEDILVSIDGLGDELARAAGFAGEASHGG